MINGFLVEVNNTTQEEQNVFLFKEMGLPKGVTVIAWGTQYDYPSLLSFAINKGFKGNGIMTDTESVDTVSIFNENEAVVLNFDHLLEDQEIIINGISKYISFTIPPSSNVLIKLMQVLE
jgi:hypothetical protein